MILERAGEGRCEERTFLADILPDRRFDIAASQCVRWFVVGSPGKDRRRRAGEEEAAGVTVELARAVPFAGDSRSAPAKACKKAMKEFISAYPMAR